jgi:murein DD-endopeptidase
MRNNWPGAGSPLSPFRKTSVNSLLVALLAATPVAAQLPPSLEVRVPKAPTVATADGASVLVYELHITNFTPQPLILQRIDVATADAARRVLTTLADSALIRAIARPGMQGRVTEVTKLDGGARALVFLWIPVDRNSIPNALRHRLYLQQGSGDGALTLQLDDRATPVAKEAAPVGPPLRGGPWLTANGPHPQRGHRRAMVPIEGHPSIAQRFAIDYVKLGDDNLTFKGDRLKNDSYHAYGVDALAVADGIVVATKDGIPENIPGPASRAVPITLETVGGNHVIIDIGGGRYAFYAHLVPGSLRVKTGDRVRRGQVVGLVGNSGNSTEPHLHFHISDGASPLGSDGLPYIHDAFEVVGRCTTVNTGCERSTPAVRRGELPLGNLVIRFPN